jgi:hypothetical protein
MVNSGQVLERKIISRLFKLETNPVPHQDSNSGVKLHSKWPLPPQLLLPRSSSDLVCSYLAFHKSMHVLHWTFRSLQVWQCDRSWRWDKESGCLLQDFVNPKSCNNLRLNCVTVTPCSVLAPRERSEETAPSQQSYDRELLKMERGCTFVNMHAALLSYLFTGHIFLYLSINFS